MEEWVRLHSEELFDLCSSLGNILVMKSSRMRSAGYVVWMGERRSAFRVLVGRPEERRPLGNLDIGGRILFKWIFKTWDGEAWTGLVWCRIGTGNFLTSWGPADFLGRTLFRGGCWWASELVVSVWCCSFYVSDMSIVWLVWPILLCSRGVDVLGDWLRAVCLNKHSMSLHMR